MTPSFCIPASCRHLLPKVLREASRPPDARRALLEARRVRKASRPKAGVVQPRPYDDEQGDEVERRAKALDAAKAAYRSKLEFLLDGAESRGASARARLLAGFRKAADEAYETAYRLGLAQTAQNPQVQDKGIDAFLDAEAEDEADYFGGFLDQVFGDEEEFDRDRRLGMYVDALDGLFHRGAVDGLPNDALIFWKLRPAEHCLDCVSLAARSPFVRPGVRHPDYDQLPTTPRKGDTRCISNCKCYLEFSPTSAEPERPARRKVGYEPKPGADGKRPDLSGGQQAAADDLGLRMQWARAMYDVTGDQSYLGKRRKWNAELIALQQASGVDLRPRATADATSRVVAAAEENGYDAVLPGRKRVPTVGVSAARVYGMDFQPGVIATWDSAKGRGTLKLASGDEVPIAVDDSEPSLLLIPRAKKWINREWRVPTATGAPFLQVPGKQASLASLASLFEASAQPLPSLALLMRTASDVLDARPAHEWVGVALQVGAGASGATLADDGVVALRSPPAGDALRRAVAEAVGLHLWALLGEAAPKPKGSWPAPTYAQGDGAGFAALYAAAVDKDAAAVEEIEQVVKAAGLTAE